MNLARTLLAALCVAAAVAAADDSLTVAGVTYENVQWGTVTRTTVTIRHRSGVATIPLEKLSPELQKRFGYDPAKAATPTAAPVARTLDLPTLIQQQTLATKRLAEEKAARLARLKEDYIFGLGALQKERTGKGDLDGVLAVKAEKARIVKGEALAPEEKKTMPAALAAQRSWYEQNLERTLTETQTQQRAVAEQYIRNLDALLKSLTMREELQAAVAVKTEKETAMAGWSALAAPNLGSVPGSAGILPASGPAAPTTTAGKMPALPGQATPVVVGRLPSAGVARTTTTPAPGQGTGPTTPNLPASSGRAQIGLPFIATVGIEFLYIPPGEFMMGSTAEEREWAHGAGCPVAVSKSEGENPRRTMIAKAFWLGRTEVTLGQWKNFVDDTHYQSDAEKKGGANWRNPKAGYTPQENHPVCYVSWNDAIVFCEWLTTKERKVNRFPAALICRLPTEAEWEYACRAGSRGRGKFWWGDETREGEIRMNGYGAKDGFDFLAPVDHFGARGRNRFGLADMLGNVWEWCLDDFDVSQAHEDCYKGNPTARVRRGGSFSQFGGFERCATRGYSAPTASGSHFGFRVACGVELKPEGK